MWFVRRRFRRGGSGTIQGVMQTIPEQLPDTEVIGSRAATQMRREEQAWNWVLDWILPLLTVLVLLASCVLGSAKKEIWIDEAYTLQVITDPSLPHMMHALANAVDGGMPLYYILAHAWGVAFGTSLSTLRLLSSIFVCAGVLLLWSTLRRAYAAWAVSLAIVATTVTSDRKSTRLNSSHRCISYAVFCL